MNSKTLGVRIATLRKEQGLTQAQLAEKLSVSNKAVSRWETGEGFPEITILQKLGQVLGVTIDELLSGEEPEPEGEVTQETLNKKPNEMLMVLLPIFIFKLAKLVGGMMVDRYVELHVMIVGALNEIHRVTSIYHISCFVLFAALLIFLVVRIKKSESFKAKQVAGVWFGAYTIAAVCQVFLKFLLGESINAAGGIENAMELISIPYIHGQIAITFFAGLACIAGTTATLRKRGVMIVGVISALIMIQAAVVFVQYFESETIWNVCVRIMENGTTLFVGALVIICTLKNSNSYSVK